MPSGASIWGRVHALAKGRALAPAMISGIRSLGGMEGATMRRQAVLAVVAAIMGIAPIAPAAGAQAQPGACAHTPAILDAGDFLLAEPATFPNFWRDRFGDDAAYLKIRYGGLAYAEGSALLAGLEKRSHPPLRIVELRLAYATTPDRAAMIAGMQPLPKAQSIVPSLANLPGARWSPKMAATGCWANWRAGRHPMPTTHRSARRGLRRHWPTLMTRRSRVLPRERKMQEFGGWPSMCGRSRTILLTSCPRSPSGHGASQKGRPRAVHTQCAPRGRSSSFLRYFQTAGGSPGDRPQE